MEMLISTDVKNMKNLIWFIVLIVVGAIALDMIDAILGIQFASDVGFKARILHKLAYACWGGVVLLFVQRKFAQ